MYMCVDQISADEHDLPMLCINPAPTRPTTALLARPTQPFILTGSINRVPTCPVGVKAGRSPLSGGR